MTANVQELVENTANINSEQDTIRVSRININQDQITISTVETDDYDPDI